MHTDSDHIPELVSAARAGDGPARERLVADYLPLVYNVVGRALDGHADVDDVVQDTMFRALDGLGGLREPARFRSWLVAIAMNQIRRRWTDRQQAAVASLERVVERPDPAGDFVDLTILRLGLSGQRREVAEATRWLDEDDRALLALWWQEAAGELTRAELAEALGVPGRHAAVRVQRMKAQLETGRVVVRTLAAEPRCDGLARLTADWDGRPAAIWRKRVARHARGCRACGGHWSGLIPAEGLLAGLALVVPLSGYPSVPAAELGAATAATAGAVAEGGVAQGAAGAVTQGASGAATHGATGAATHDASASAAHGPSGPVADGSSRVLAGGVPPSEGSSGAAVSGPAGGVPRWRVPAVVGGLVLGGVLSALLWPATPRTPVPSPSDAPSRGNLAAPQSPTASPTAARTPSPTVSPAVTPGPASVPPPPPSASVTRRAEPTVAERLTELVNARRAEAGCGPLRLDARLTAAARAHARDMVARRYFGHASPEGRHADSRIAEAGYDPGAWAENLHRGPRDAAGVVDDWMDGSIHEENMLGCEYRDTGVAAVPGPEGMVWVQTLAGPA
ncbi:sigma-70 family RNA polymerase sigma factor [Streptomyces sp. TRM49041]|uniref:sigma-70 family RNA polymerase sigma factor n=1 Tax=Streptomyces sp. TRM49041 TaxID=2603216 RepID=UPI0011EF2609|nr:sigma-70 family RNA polymerase sigma factor [Streptomyces sp. TRM49041]